LNLLTPTNFDQVKKEILDLAKINILTCEYVVTGIMDKACTEDKYTNIFAKLCDYLIKKKNINHQIEEKEGEESKENKKKKDNSFREQLILAVQNTFEGNREVVQTKIPLEKMDDDELNKYF